MKAKKKDPEKQLVRERWKDYEESMNFLTVILFGLIHPDSWIRQTYTKLAVIVWIMGN